MKEVIINQNDAGQRLDKFLLKTFPQLPKSVIYKAVRNKKIKINRKRCEFNQVLNEDDHILLFIDPALLEEKEREALHNYGPIDVVYEDDNILIVNKQAGLLTQSDTKEDQDCLVARIQYYLYRKGAYDPSKENSFAPAVCNRLDRNTSGLVIAAKNAAALRIVNEAIANRKIHKNYMALVEGIPSWEKKEVSCYIKKEGTKAIVRKDPQKGFQHALETVRLMKVKKNQSICQIELKTGRFHQIRATMAWLGYPLVGDSKYGYKGKRTPIQLCAYRLEFEDINLDLKQKIFEISSQL